MVTTVKSVLPVGQLLSETDTGVDYLGESVYADAIAESIHLTKTSITIGVYAKWGSGKSFLLRHVESILRRYQKQSVVDGHHVESSAKTIYHCSKARQLFLWIFVLILIFGLIAATLILAIDPTIFAPYSTEIEGSSSSTENTNSTEFTTTTSPLEEYQNRVATLKIVGLVLIPVELLTIFLIGCFGRTWASKGQYSGFNILMYGAFTKLPPQNAQPETLEDPGQAPANILRYAPQGSERLAMAASEEVEFPRRYIFVDFKAWEYAGSDTLWAAIVTKISDAIEAEFGTIATRLFRMLTIKEVARKALGNSNRSLYIQFSSGARLEEIQNMLKRYGVIQSLEPLGARAEDNFKWWMISYSSDGEYRNAKASLKIEGVSFRTRDPSDPLANPNSSFKRSKRGRESSHHLVHEHEDVPLKEMNTREEEDESDADEDADIPPVQLDALSKICCCCDRFCFHFVRHPVKQWKLPRLFWWIILPICCLLIPVTAYIFASSLNLDVERTYRAVPMFGQVLLWLPASAAVALAVSKFAWAMCHSQRQRIHQALDGTKGRMASQLGFMNKVKSEIQVMTNLIRCARFIQQKDYKVIITIDDLDQVDLKKVHSVLQAVSILLSDKSSPFVCLIAADPRIVVKCVEESLGSPLKNAKVTGREYLKKIINLPVCLPEIKDSNKRRYVAGLIDQSDHTVTYRLREQKNKTDHRGHRRAGAISNSARADTESNGAEDVVDGSPAVELDHGKFLFECRNFLYDNKELHRHLHGNPRNIKRIFNILTMTACVINCMVKKQERQEFMRTRVKGSCYQAPVIENVDKIVRTAKLAEDLVLWISLVDQWPYRTSYIIQIIEDSDQRAAAGFKKEEIPNDLSIVDIYKNEVQKKVLETPDENLITLDDDPDLFQTYLLLLKSRGFTKDIIIFLLKLTINLDYSIRRTIAFTLNPPPLPTQDINEATVTLAKENEADTDSDHSTKSKHSGPENLPETVC